MTQAIILELGVHLFLFCAVVFVVLSFLGEFSQTAEELKEKAGDDIDRSLAELYIALSPESFFALRLAAAAVLFLLGYLLLDVILGLILALVGFFGPVQLLKRLKMKRVQELEVQLIEALELLRNGLKSGLTIQQASELVVQEFPPPISQEFSLVLAESRLGVDFIDGLQNMADRLDSAIVQILASGVAITKRCGGDLGEIFGNLADTIREQAKIEGKLQAVTAQGRFQGLILGAMPFLLLIVLYFIDQAHVKTLFGNQVGIIAFAGVVGMVMIAQLWIRKLMDIDV